MAGSQRSVEERNNEWSDQIDGLFEEQRRYRIGCRKCFRKMSNSVDVDQMGDCSTKQEQNDRNLFAILKQEMREDD